MRLLRKSMIKGLDISCPKILLKPMSVKGFMNLAMRRTFKGGSVLYRLTAHCKDNCFLWKNGL